MFTKFCRNCGNRYQTPRSDSVYCCDNCKAQYDRAKGTGKGYVHEEKPRWNECECEYCHGTFWINAYAVREGKRKARFCSTRCRVAWHRKHKTGFEGETYQSHETHEKARKTPPKDKNAGNAGNAGKHEEKREKSTNSGQGAPKSNKYYYSNRDGHLKAFEFLGCTISMSYTQVRVAYLKMISKWHPDVCKEPDALQMSQAINAAWETCQKWYGKR